MLPNVTAPGRSAGVRRWEVGLPLGFLVAVCTAMLVAILGRTGGVFVYTLDDPYIHLALAEEIARGHYGVSPGAFAAPSSSVLWPFLLAPTALLPGSDLVPLVLNVIFASATAVVMGLVVRSALRTEGARPSSGVVAAAVVGIIVATNLVGLVFTGMEHSAQVLLSALAVWGLWQERTTARVPVWLAAVLVLGPLVRYENLAVSVPALGYLLARGHRRAVLLTSIALVASLGAFSLFLLSRGGGILPSSVLAKATLNEGTGGVLRGLVDNLRWGQGRLMALGAVPLLVVVATASRPTAERWLAAALTATTALHLVAGQFGWQSRYEVYAWTAVLLGLVLLYGRPLAAFVAREARWKTVGLIAVASVALGLQYVKDDATIPAAAQNIYEQQFQLHRLATEFYRAPIAVNDLGWTSYRNDHYVLDLYGLGSYEALRLRTTTPDSEWITDLAWSHGVGLAAVYQGWFPDFPTSWRHLGVLRREGRLVSAGGNEVHLYARTSEAAAVAIPALRAWSATLPPGVRFDVAPER